MTSAILDRRLAAQRISRGVETTASKLVGWLGAVQAQDYGASKWAVGLRLGDGVTDADIERSLVDASLVRTHALRGTWQLMAPQDVHWILELVGPRIIAANARRYRELSLDAAAFRKSAAAIEKALGGGECLTRDELRATLSRARIDASDQRLAFLLQRAELDGLVCNGPRRGKQLTHALLDDRVHRPERRLSRTDALGELARRYFQSRGPAAVDDFAWWAGLSAAEARAGHEATRARLHSDVVAGRALWRSDGSSVRPRGTTTYLLPAFDEYLVGYRNRDAVLDPEIARRVNAGGGILAPIVVSEGRAIGTWSRELRRSTVHVAVETWKPVPRATRDAIERAARRYATFLGLEARLSLART